MGKRASRLSQSAVQAGGEMTPAEFKAIRSKLGLSQSRLAAFLGLRSKSHISRIENGKQIVTGPVARLMLLLDVWGPRLLKEK